MSNDTFLPTRKPHTNIETQEFWEGCGQGRFLVPRCNNCAHLIWYPRQFCTECGQMEVTWEEMSGRGSVYSYSISNRGQGEFAEAAPYVLAYVELEEGPRVLTNIVDCDPSTVEVGQAVTVVFEAAGETKDGKPLALYRFRPTQ